MLEIIKGIIMENLIVYGVIYGPDGEECLTEIGEVEVDITEIDALEIDGVYWYPQK